MYYCNIYCYELNFIVDSDVRMFTLSPKFDVAGVCALLWSNS